MSLARIVTDSPERVAALAEYLRSCGYTVELIGPGTVRAAQAELEMDLQGCSAEEALSRGVTAVGAQGHSRRAIAYDITGRPVEFASDEEERPASGGNAIAQAWNGLAAATHEIGENLRLYRGRFGEWFHEGRQAIQEQVARRQQRREVDALARQKERERQAELLAERARQADLEQEVAARREQAERIRREREQAARLAESERARRAQQEAARVVEQAAAQERLRRQQEQTHEQERAAREGMILEQYRREAHLDATRERFKVEQQQARQNAAPPEAVIARREPVRRWEQVTSGRDHDWKKAAVASIVLALLATLGYAAYESRRPASPLTNRDLVNSEKISQPVPFGTATIAPSQTAPPQASRAPQAQRALPQSDAPVARKSAEQPVPKHRARRSSRFQDDMIADDEVVVHHRSSAAPTRAAAGTSPKRISDLE